MLEHINIRIFTHLLDEAFLYFKSCVVRMMEYPEFRMPPFAVKVKFAVFFLVKIHSPVNKLPYLSRGAFHYFLNGFRAA